MSKILIDEAVVRQALDYLIAYEVKIDSEWGDCREMEQIDRDGDTPDIIIALRKVLSDAALDKKADNARELGLSYEQPAQQEPDHIEDVLAMVPPPECKTEAEKTAFAFGWYKALESVREEKEPDPDELTIAYMSGVYEGKKRKPWVGLTDEDKEFIAKRAAVYDWHDYEVIDAIEAKLKEKNTKGGAA